MAELEPKNLDYFKKRFGQAKQARARFEPDWFLNLSFLVGDQWVWWNRSRLDRIPKMQGRVLLVDNRIRGVVDTRVARQMKSRPSYQATPFSLDESDVESARLGEKICEADYIEQELGRKLHTALIWKEVSSAGFWKIYWDKTKGEAQTFVLDPQTNQPLADSNGRPIRQEDLVQQFGPDVAGQYPPLQVASGSVCIDPISPFEFYPAPLATSMEDCEWAVECKVRSTEYVKQRYKLGNISADAQSQPGIAESRLMGAIGSEGPIPQGAPDQKQGVKVYEYWCRPEPNYPKGCRVVWANDKILESDDAPFDPMPYVMFSGQRVAGRFWPSAMVSQLRGPQSSLNKLESQIQESAERLGHPSLLWNKFFGMDNLPQGLPGETIFYDGTVPGSKPEYAQPPEVPAYVQNQLERVEASIQEISGLHEVSKATVPSGVTAASAINLLQEADDTRLGPEVADAETAIAAAGTKSLKLYAAFASSSRLIRLAGEEGDWDVFEFRGNMLRNNTNVEVQAGSMMPRSKAAKMAAMTEVFGLALQYGVPLEARNVRAFFRDYEVGALDKLFANIAPAESQIIWENRMLSKGQQLPVNTYDDDDLHVKGHEDFQNSAKYRNLDPKIKAVVEQHVGMHRQRRIQIAQQQVQQQQQEQSAQMAQQLQFELQKNAVSTTARQLQPAQNGGQ